MDESAAQAAADPIALANAELREIIRDLRQKQQEIAEALADAQRECVRLRDLDDYHYEALCDRRTKLAEVVNSRDALLKRVKELEGRLAQTTEWNERCRAWGASPAPSFDSGFKPGRARESWLGNGIALPVAFYLAVKSAPRRLREYWLSDVAPAIWRRTGLWIGIEPKDLSLDDYRRWRERGGGGTPLPKTDSAVPASQGAAFSVEEIEL